MKAQTDDSNLKVLLSIGGWTYSPNFANIGNPAWRAQFVESSVRLVEDVGLDGLDIDYEYPKTAADADAYVQLLGELRAGLENLAKSKGAPQGQYQLTVAAPCGVDNVSILKIQAMDSFLDFWNLMAYDFAGSWDQVAGHQANLYADNNGQSVDKAVNLYLAAGVPPHKLTLGLPAYGRAFCNTQGPGTPFSGVGKGSWEDGMWDYKALPPPGAEVINDHRLGASYSFDRNTGTMISYDTQAIVIQKAQYINKMGLGGAMWWELDADATEDTGKALIRTVREQFGQLEYRQNDINYPGSSESSLGVAAIDNVTRLTHTCRVRQSPQADELDETSEADTWVNDHIRLS
jgi:chitinase